MDQSLEIRPFRLSVIIDACEETRPKKKVENEHPVS